MHALPGAVLGSALLCDVLGHKQNICMFEFIDSDLTLLIVVIPAVNIPSSYIAGNGVLAACSLVFMWSSYVESKRI